MTRSGGVGRTRYLKSRVLRSLRSRSSAQAVTADAAVFSGYYPPHAGGIELVCADLIHGLCHLGMNINWVALEGGPFAVHANCTLSPLKGTDIVYRRSGVPFPLPWPTSTAAVWSAIRNAKVIVIAEANFPISIAAFAMAKIKSKPILLMQHLGAPSTVSGIARMVMCLAERIAVRPMLRAADSVVYISPAVANYFADVRTRHVPQLIGHGVDTDLFAPCAGGRLVDRGDLGLAPNAKIACFAGRCTVSKGIEVVMRMARLRPDWHFLIAGDGPIDPASQDLPNLTALGHVDRPTLAKVYRVADVLVLPSCSESFSLVVREAMAAGTRVLCGDQILETDPRIHEYVTARAVDLQNPEATAQTFAAALDEPSVSAAESRRAYVIEHCSWPNVFRAYAGIIRNLAASS
jgi:glycosyltransferase involved in cell wall biosynthesis